MQWVTREHIKVDRVACPWLIFRFIDEDAELQFVPVDEVMTIVERDGAIPFDMPGVELGHKNGQCSFEAFLDKYCLTDPALNRLALIVRAADTDDRDAAPEGAGLRAAATGFSMLGFDDIELLELQFPLYDALYEWCKAEMGSD